MNERLLVGLIGLIFSLIVVYLLLNLSVERFIECSDISFINVSNVQVGVCKCQGCSMAYDPPRDIAPPENPELIWIEPDTTTYDPQHVARLRPANQIIYVAKKENGSFRKRMLNALEKRLNMRQFYVVHTKKYIIYSMIRISI